MSFRRHKFTKVYSIADSRGHFLKKCRRCGTRKIGHAIGARCYGKALREERQVQAPAQV